MTIQENETSKKILNTLTNGTIHIQKNTHLVLGGVFLKGWQTRAHLDIFLEGEGARFDCFFFILGVKKETFPFTVSIKHIADHTTSFVVMRSILFNESKVDSHGFIRVEHDAEDTNTSFSHHALLASEKASATLLPVLEIHTNSSQAHHSTSVAQVDADACWYLMSRGISEKNANKLLLQGFFEQDMKKITDQNVRHTLEKKLQSFRHIYA